MAQNLKGTIVWIVLIAVVALIVLWIIKGYNSMVTQEENVSTAWSQVENQYQRRSDLIPNLVSIVKGYATHEKSTLDAVVSARANATSITVDPNKLTAENIQAYQQAQGELSTALGRLIMIKENYPDLKANKNFLELQSQLEGTENRIVVARNAYNEAARKFNTLIRRFPNNLIANIFAFELKAYFEADEGSKKAPTIEF